MGVAGILWTMRMRIEAILLAVIGATLIVVFLGIDPFKDLIHRGNDEAENSEPSEAPAESIPQQAADESAAENNITQQ